MTTPLTPHQYIVRETARVATEQLIADPLINRLYSHARENATLLFKAATSRRMSAILGYLNFDMPFSKNDAGDANRIKAMGIDLTECLDRPQDLNTARRLFERKIQYWQCRPMPRAVDRIVSPADARMIVGSFDCHGALFLKEKFFSFYELIGEDKKQWTNVFEGGEFALFRLTPDKYHYNHVPVSGRVKDIYTIDGCCHSCNPGAVVAMVTPFSKNRRVVTVIDTDVPGGTGIGLVAMIEMVAMMSALMVGYALGEGIGRLACISFGCCYGKPIDQMPQWVQRYLSWATFRFTGCTKKIVYAHHLEGKRIFAVQAVTAVLYSATALIGTLLFLNGIFAWAFFVCLWFPVSGFHPLLAPLAP